jgi:hypothetical protein
MRRATIYLFVLAVGSGMVGSLMATADYDAPEGLRRPAMVALSIAATAVVALAIVLLRGGTDNRRRFFDDLANLAVGGLLLLLLGAILVFWGGYRDHRAGFLGWARSVCGSPLRVEKHMLLDTRCFYCKAYIVPDEFRDDVLDFGGVSAFVNGVEVCTDDF